MQYQKTKAIMPVHLTGRICEMNKINKIAKKYKIPVIEDAAQAIGSKYFDKPSGSLSEIGCFSAHPLKNLNAAGDGGYISTNNKKIYEKFNELKNHGMIDRNKIKNFGYVSRMDNLQAAILNYRLKKFRNVIRLRRNNFKLYENYLDKNFVFFPEEKNTNSIHITLLLFKQIRETNYKNIYLKMESEQQYIIQFRFIYNQHLNQLDIKKDLLKWLKNKLREF